MRRIVITGSESTGKTILADQLAKSYQCMFIPEFARAYIENLKRPYNYQDIIKIGRRQLDQYQEVIRSGESVIFDTWLIITKVWLKVVYDKQERWIEDSIRTAKIDLYILCSNDLPWEPDPVRENGGEMRDTLFEMYREELENLSLPYRIIQGKDEDRLRNTIIAIDEFFNKK